MNQALGVDQLQALAQTAKNALCLRKPIRWRVGSPAIHQRTQVRTIDVLHGNPRVLARHARFVHLHHRRVPEVPQREKLALKPFHFVGLSLAGVEDLHGRHVVGLVDTPVDRRHAAHAEQLAEHIGPDRVTGGWWRRHNGHQPQCSEIWTGRGRESLGVPVR